MKIVPLSHDDLKSLTYLAYSYFNLNQKSSAPRGGVWKSFARKPLVSIASLYFSPQGAGNYTHTRLKLRRQHPITARILAVLIASVLLGITITLSYLIR
jgi:hypothetical protein